jgi:xanthine dehydrogenase YagR molybdenum-binding subunit
MFAGCVSAKRRRMRRAAGRARSSGHRLALYEGRQVDAATGAVLTAGLEDYRIPGIADIPDMHIHFDEGGFDHVAGGGVGIGEISTLPVAAAVANAIHNATGRRARELPIRPDRLLALLGAGRVA